jgi:dTMP kinase
LQSRDRLEAESNDFHERVRQEYLQIAMMDPERYFVVDGAQPVDEIHSQIIARVAELPALKRSVQGPQQNKILKPIHIATSAVTKRIKK